MNKTQLIGRLTKDIDLRTTQSGKSVCSFTLAVNRRTKDEGADFISCVAWNKTAENMSKYLKKGDRVGICGRLSVRSYEDKHKETRYVTEVIVDELDFLRDSGKSAAQADAAEDNDPLSIADDDLPF